MLAGPRPGKGRAHCLHRAAAHPAPSHTNTQSQQPPGGNIDSVSLFIKLMSIISYILLHGDCPGKGRVLVGLVAGPAPGTMSTQSLDYVYRRSPVRHCYKEYIPETER